MAHGLHWKPNKKSYEYRRVYMFQLVYVYFFYSVLDIVVYAVIVCCLYNTVSGRPVARGSWGSVDTPNFQKFTNLVAVIHSLLQKLKHSIVQSILPFV